MRSKCSPLSTILTTALIYAIAFAVSLTACGQDPAETVRIESDLVDLKVSVLGPQSDAPAQMLAQKDFQVLEDGQPQEIAFFAAADAPFDLILLLDLSGSTSNKLKMIKKSAKRFIDSTRPVDRIAIVTFTDRAALTSPFSLNRKELKKAIDDIDDAFGGTNFWDALNYALTELVPQNHGLRRSAIVVMSDGVDNALPDVAGPGSSISFDELLTNVRNSEAIIFPIYLDTEKEDVQHFHMPRSAYVEARKQLAQIAAACGTTVYRAAKLKDLEQVYPRVVRDLGTVYSIGYRPINRNPDGKWRSVEVRLVGRPDLSVRTKSGYYPRPTPTP